jgi:hypothetical protein
MRAADIKAMHRELGDKGFITALADLLEGRDQLGQQIPKLNAAQVSIRALFEGLVGPCDEKLPSHLATGRLNYVEMQEAVDSTMFPSATGVLIASKVIEGYNSPGMIGDQLVTTMQSKLKSERIVGFTSLEGPQEVPEGMPYLESSFGEKYVTTQTAKKGRILEITEETIFFDQTGQIMMRAQRLGEQTAEERELTILAGVLDVGSGANGIKDVYFPQGTQANLYSTTNANLAGSSSAIALVNWTDIDEVLQFHATNIRDDRAVSAERLPIVWMPKILLVGRVIAGTAASILNSTQIIQQPGATDASVQTWSPNPIGGLVPGLRALSSPLIDYLAGVTGSRYNDARDWFLGDFQKQFVWQEIWPLQTLRSRQDDEPAFRRDVVARFKVRYYGGIAALDHRYVIKVNAA